MPFDQVTPLVIPSNLNNLTDYEYSQRYQLEYSYAIPCEEALAALVNLFPKWVEIGAGGGYWAQLLRERGADVLAFDQEPDPDLNDWISRQWGPVAKAPATVAGEHPDRALLLIWPANYRHGHTVASDALESYGGQTVAYIGEGKGEIDADDRFFELLESGWDELQTVWIPRWATRYDRLEIYRRR